MDAERLAFVFGPGFDPAHWDDLLDPEDLDERSRLYEAFLPYGSGVERASREIVANRILDDVPPETWATAQRLLAAGLDRERVLNQLAMVALESLLRALDGETPDPDDFVAGLERLPLPDLEEVEAAMVDLVACQPGIALGDLARRTAAAVGGDEDDSLVEQLCHRVADALLEHGVFTLLHPDRVVHPATVAAGIVLTHRLTEEERDDGIVNLDFDLPPIVGEQVVVLGDGRFVVVGSAGYGDCRLHGPEGWLDGFAAGDLLAMRLELPEDDGHDHDDDDADPDADHEHEPAVLHLEVAPEPDAADTEGLASRLREVYDREVAEARLPLGAGDLMLGLLLEDGETFSTPRAPLSELADEAGLERRLDQVAHEASVWRAGAQMDRMRRIEDFFEGDESASESARFVLDLADLAAGEDPASIGIEGLDSVDASSLRRAFTALDDELVLYFVADEVAEAAGGAEEDQAWAEALVEALVGAASRPRDVAAARYLAARHAEVRGDTLVAEQHLVLAEKADPDNPAVIDRLGWYAADRGDAARAERFWRRLAGTPMVDEDLERLAPFLAAATSAGRSAPGRNDPCWCGSGRKYKQCHQGELPRPTLAERVPWLARKAAAFVTRRLDLTEDDAVEVALARTQVGTAPDAVARAFQDPLVLDLVLTEGGWFEEFVAQRGPLLPDDERLLAESWLLVDRSVHEVVATDPGASLTLQDLRTGDELVVTERTFSRFARVGECYALRAVPDGEGHQIVGGIFPVRTGHEAAVLDLLDRADPVEIATWVADLERPPTLVLPDGQELSWEEAADLVAAADRDDGDWLDPDDPEAAAALEQFLRQAEERWCDEPVPALGGRTPRECAVDPTRRPALERLLVEFERHEENLPPSAGTFDVGRLRALLDL